MKKILVDRASALMGASREVVVTGRTGRVNEKDAGPVMRVTVPFLKVYPIFLDNPSEQFSGAEICRRAKLKSGTVYPLLIKLEEGGWLTSKWEAIDPKKEGRPKRRLYRITRKGITHGKKILDEHFPAHDMSSYVAAI